MDGQHAQDFALQYAAVVISYVERIPGSGIVLRYIKSSYQNDPIRSAIELILFLFAVRYLLAPSYSTKKPMKEPLSEEVRARISQLDIEQFAYTEQEIDDLVEDWTPEPIVSPLTEFEQTELERRPVIVGYVKTHLSCASGGLQTEFWCHLANRFPVRPVRKSNSLLAKSSRISPRRTILILLPPKPSKKAPSPSSALMA